MGFSFDRTDDGMLILRDILVEPDVPTIMWYLDRTNETEDLRNLRPGPFFARARRRRKRPDTSSFRREDGSVSPETARHVEALAREARGFLTPVAFLRFDPVTDVTDDGLRLAGIPLQSRRLRQLLDGCGEAAVFLCSLGHGIEEPIRAKARKSDKESRVLEAVASAALLDLTQAIQRRVEAIARTESLHVTHCQWPGFCDWPEEQTEALMGRVGGTVDTPVAWRDQAFHPVWSFLGLVGLGKNVSRIKNNPCRTCDKRRDCPRRVW